MERALTPQQNTGVMFCSLTNKHRNNPAVSKSTTRRSDGAGELTNSFLQNWVEMNLNSPFNSNSHLSTTGRNSATGF